jgi:hypothetical protein
LSVPKTHQGNNSFPPAVLFCRSFFPAHLYV